MSSRSKKSKTRNERGFILQTLFFFLIFGTLTAGAGIIGVYWYFSRNLPQIISVADYRPLGVSRIFANNGKGEVEIGEFYKERRYLVPYEKIPEVVVRAFISAEDDKFFEHGGINIVSMIRAGIANFRAGHVVQGGSTITQQVAKSLLLTPERSFDRKIKEIILANRIETHLTKQQILYLYLNQIYLGHGAYGVQAASRTYFQKDVSQLTPAEAALLAGMPQAPGKYSPLLNPKKAKERQLYVLKRMLENHYITQDEMKEATSKPLRIFHDEDLNKKYAPYFVEHIRKYLTEKYGDKMVYEDGLTVTVPMTPELALTATKSVKEGLLAVDKRIGYRGPITHLANQKEVDKFLADQRIKLINAKLHYQLFLPDGRLDPEEALRFEGIKSEAELLDPGELYQGVVTGFNSAAKTAQVSIGTIQAELPLSKMRWARPARDENNPYMPRPEPKLPSSLFKIGDVIWVRLAENSNASSPQLLVGLEQEPQIQGALFSLDAKTGYVLAMVGGYDFDKSEFNRAVQAQRQPGSAFKPIIYSSALEKGFTPASIIVDSPIVFKDTEGSSSWKPNNYEEKFYGDTTLGQALIKSRNIPTIKLVQAVQVPYLIQYAKRLGINSQFNPDLSISLGSASISLADLTRVYSLFPRLGRKVTPIYLSKVMDRDGRILEEYTPQPLPDFDKVWNEIESAEPVPAPSPGSAESTAIQSVLGRSKIVFPQFPLSNDPDQVIDPRNAYVMTHLMTEVVTYGTGHDAQSLGRPAAGKTGTTNESIDTWFVGFTPYVVTGVWVGYDSQKSIGPAETGARVALPIWLSFMKEAVKPYPADEFPIPPGVVFVPIDPNTGKPAGRSSSFVKEAFVAGTQPTGEGETEGTASEAQSDFFKEDKE